MDRKRFELIDRPLVDWIHDKKLKVYFDETNLCYLVDLLNEQDEKIEQLEEQLSKSIAPKFEIGQEVFVVDPVGYDVVYHTQITSIRIFDRYEFSYYTKYDLDTQERLYLDADEEFIFATRDEAEQYMQSLKKS